MNKCLYFFVFSLLKVSAMSCQTKGEEVVYVLSNEYVKKKNPQTVIEKSVGINGVANNKLVIFGGSEGLTEKYFLYDEKTQDINSYLTLPNISDKVLGILAKDNKVLKSGYMAIPQTYRDYRIEDIPIDSLPYQDFWIQDGNAIVKIDRYPFHYLDKVYDAKFSSIDRYLIVNPYNDATAGYWPEDDDRFYVYDLVNFKSGEVKKQTIKCEQCMNTNLVDHKFIFVREIEIGGGRDGYYRNIYSAPEDNINDTVKIAHDINLIQLSSDGKFILGKKYLYGEYTPVIIEVASKRFQYLLGRDYPMEYSFYSPYEKKFAFDFGSHFVYINFPDTYPFDALSQNVNNTSKTENAAFWKMFQHETLK
jgi:hypothetical protein